MHAKIYKDIKFHAMLVEVHKTTLKTILFLENFFLRKNTHTGTGTRFVAYLSPSPALFKH